MKQHNRRIGLIMAAVFVIAGLIGLKLLYVQVFNNEMFSAASLSNRLTEVALMPDRGVIYDAKGETLAISVQTDSVFISPKTILGLKEKDRVVNDLSAILGISKSRIHKLLKKKDSEFEWLVRFEDTKKTKKLRDKNYAGVGFIKETKREYPRGTLASQVVGFTSIDSQGLNGAELQFNDILSGNVGQLTAERDGKGNIIPQTIRESIPATPGDNVYLTIDSTIQYIVERELEKAMKEWKALQVTCIVQDVKTGNILAMAGHPTYDPNHFNDYKQETWKNLALSKVYEPGSVFKVVSTSMYLDDGVATPDSQYYCPGFMTIDGHEFRCWSYPRGQGAETLKQGLANSCNIVQAKTVERLGKDRFYDYLNGFGFTRKTGIDLPGESAPVLVAEDRAVPLDLAAMAIGQANAYTPVQMIGAISAVANGGNLMKPQVVSKITDRKGQIVKEVKPELVRRVVSEHSAAQMRDMMEFVVTDGIGKEAAVPGYRVAGKTGTGEIAQDGRYEKGNYNLSFGGFAPANDPKIACIVIVNSPQTNASSGTVAGPVFASIVSEIMRYYEVPSSQANKNIEETKAGEVVEVPDLKLPMPVDEAMQAFQSAGLQLQLETQGPILKTYFPEAGTRVSKGSMMRGYAGTEEATDVIMPDLTGKTIKEADRFLQAFGLRRNFDGSGLAWYQWPAAGARINSGSEVVVRFASADKRAAIEELNREKMQKAQEAARKAVEENNQQNASGSRSSPTEGDANP